jgi:hypothetical protein
MIGIALLGAGYAARIQLTCWREIPGVTVIGVWNRSAERARTPATEFDVPSFAELDPLQKFWTGRREKVKDDSFAPSAMIPASAWGHVLSRRERGDERV